jgi:D-alanine-D-alanine ligase
MKKLRVLVLMHEDLVPPEKLEGSTDEEIAKWKTEFDVCATLREIGHDIRPLGVRDDLGRIREAIVDWKPHVAFNLLEEFHGVGLYDQHVASYLELMRQPYTGCNPRGLTLTHDKPLMKQILSYHRIPTPKFWTIPLGRKRISLPSKMSFPLLVKSAVEDASLGISQASVVRNEEKLRARVQFVHEQLETDALVEQFIEGRELYVGAIGNQRLVTFPVWEMVFKNMPDDSPRIATARVKWDEKYQKKHGIATDEAKDLPQGVEERIIRLTKRAYRSLYLSGYARMDFRLTDDGALYCLEANANPNLSYGEDFAESAERSGLDYDALLQRIITLGSSYRAAWKT